MNVTFKTKQGCTVHVARYTDAKGVAHEDITLECLLELALDSRAPVRRVMREAQAVRSYFQR